MSDTSDFDPTRLTALARTRDTRRAIARDIQARYQQIREARADLLRRAQVANLNASTGHGVFKEESLAAAERLNAEAEDLRSQMTELQAQGDAETADAAEAARLLTSCLAFATEHKLAIPAALAAEARPRAFAPLALEGGAA